MSATAHPSRRPGPVLQAPVFTALLSLFAAIVLALASAFMAGPDFLKLYKELGSGDPSDVEAITASIQGILSPGVSLLGMATALALGVFLLALLWLFIAVIIRLAGR